MIANPNIRIVRRHDSRGKEIVLGLEAPVRGIGLCAWGMDSEADRALLVAALPVVNGDSNGNYLAPEDYKRLVALGILIPKRRASIARKFVCKLNPIRKAGNPAQELVLAASVHFEASGRVPAIYSNRDFFVEGLDLSGATVWVENPATRIVFPFRVGERWVGPLVRLLAGKTSVSELRVDARRAFQAAGILLSAAEVRALRKMRLRLRGKLRTQIKSQLFSAPFDLGFPRLQLLALQGYYRFLAKEGWFNPSCQQSPGRMVIHNEAASCFFHRQMAHLTSSLMGTRWKPSYCFLARYHPSADLRRHVDREQCGMSISWQVEHAQRVERGRAWPLNFDIPAKQGPPRIAAARLLDGEAVAFQGTQLPHFRHPLPARHTATFLFLHFVDGRFSGAMD